MFSFCAFLVVWFVTSIEAQRPSPCPGVFEYETGTEQPGRWFGTVTLVSDTELNGVWMRIVFDQPPTQLGNWFGQVDTKSSNDYLVKNREQTLRPNEPLSIRFYVTYSENGPVPNIKEIRLNGKTVCPNGNALLAPSPPPSPCPALFTYEPRTEADRWFGTATLISDAELSGIWLRVLFDQPPLEVGTNDFGKVKKRGETDYLISNREYILKANSPLQVRFFVKYPAGGPVPAVTGFRLNSITKCPDGSSSSSTFAPVATIAPLPVATTVINLQPQNGDDIFIQPGRPQNEDDNDYFGGDFRPGRPPLVLTPQVKDVQCGKVQVQPTPLITHGQRTIEGEWPWHAALYHTKGTDLTYICGGSLISRYHVLTVAHCVCRKRSAQTLKTESLTVYLGKYYLRRWSGKGIQDLEVEKLFVHNGYNPETFSNDIAMIKVQRPAEITQWVRPVCIWQDSTDLSSVLDKYGSVVGWGYDETGKLTEELMQAQMPVVTQQTCIWSYPDFFSRFTSDQTFCAGFKNGTSVCNGDSGGGLVFPRHGATPNDVTWQLRGLVSISVALQDQFVCDSKHFVVFTDVAKYLDWVRAGLNS